MAEDVRVSLKFKNLAGMTQPLIEGTVEDIKTSLGFGYDGDVQQTDRPHGLVWTRSNTAKFENSSENTLLKALGGVNLDQ